LPSPDQGNGDFSTLFAPFDLLIFGAPVIAFNAPKYFIQFLHRLPDGNGRRVILFLNAGGERWADIGYASTILRGKGYVVTNEVFFLTVGNMILRTKDDETGELLFTLFGWKYRQNARKIFAQCRADVAHFVRRVLAGESLLVQSSLLARISYTALRWVFYYLACPTFKWCVYANRSCTLCGICARACPTGNIRILGKKVKFGTACTVCYRCLNVCPEQAILFRWPMRQFGNDVAYFAPGWKPPQHADRAKVKGQRPKS
jgi:ferredoxin